MTTSHRYTTSSRKPGAVQHGAVQVQTSGLATCDDCGKVTTDLVSSGQHSPHWETNTRGDQVLVNCVGLPVRRSA